MLSAIRLTAHFANYDEKLYNHKQLSELNRIIELFIYIICSMQLYPFFYLLGPWMTLISVCFQGLIVIAFIIFKYLNNWGILQNQTAG